MSNSNFSNSNTSNTDSYYMRKCFALARRALGSTSPNPAVGAVLVKDSKIIGKGWHAKAGACHAEVAAIKNAKELNKNINLSGATIYVSLEPCNHRGKTPPCTSAILDCGISRLVFSVADPNVNVNGGGASFLKSKGVVVSGGVLELEGQALIQAWLSSCNRDLPFVSLIGACDISGKQVSLEDCLESNASLKRAYGRLVSYVDMELGATDGDISSYLREQKKSGVVEILSSLEHATGMQLFKNKLFDRCIVLRDSNFKGEQSLFKNISEQALCLSRVRVFGNTIVSTYKRP